MKNPLLFYGAIVIAIIGLALGVFFLIPGVNHVLVDAAIHPKHALAFFALGVLGVIAALVTRPKSAVR